MVVKMVLSTLKLEPAHCRPLLFGQDCCFLANCIMNCLVPVVIAILLFWIRYRTWKFVHLQMIIDRRETIWTRFSKFYLILFFCSGLHYKNTFQSYNYGLHIYSNVQIGDGTIPEIIFFFMLPALVQLPILNYWYQLPKLNFNFVPLFVCVFHIVWLLLVLYLFIYYYLGV